MPKHKPSATSLRNLDRFAAVLKILAAQKHLFQPPRDWQRLRSRLPPIATPNLLARNAVSTRTTPTILPRESRSSYQPKHKPPHPPIVTPTLPHQTTASITRIFTRPKRFKSSYQPKPSSHHFRRFFHISSTTVSDDLRRCTGAPSVYSPARSPDSLDVPVNLGRNRSSISQTRALRARSERYGESRRRLATFRDKQRVGRYISRIMRLRNPSSGVMRRRVKSAFCT